MQLISARIKSTSLRTSRHRCTEGLTGGRNNEGAIFRITASGAEKTLYSFRGISDGSEPFGRLLAIGDQLYGTAPAGGSNGDGTLYRFTP
jgi:uncharacterized repeat protein (TIGR03803 family)